MGRPVRRSSAVPSRGDARCEPSGSPPAEARCERRRFPMRLPILTSLVTAALLGVAVPASAQTFVFGAQGEPVQLDPAVITDGISSRLTRQIFDGLVKYRGATARVDPAPAGKSGSPPARTSWRSHLRRAAEGTDVMPPATPR